MRHAKPWVQIHSNYIKSHLLKQMEIQSANSTLNLLLPIILLLIGLGLGFAAHLMMRRKQAPQGAHIQPEDYLKEQQANAFLQKKNEDTLLQLEALQKKNEELAEKWNQLAMSYAREQERNRSLEEKLQNQKSELEEMNRRLMKEFENISHRLLKANADDFNKTSMQSLGNIVGPLRDYIAKFEEKIQDTRAKQAEETGSLKQQIASFQEVTQKWQHEARNLSTALKGENKKQGDWGEIGLEVLLEHAGLIKGKHYQAQESHKNEGGGLLRPDIILYLPDHKHIIVDAKVSLTSFWDYNASEDPKIKKEALKRHVLSVRRHIQELSAKNYEKLYTINSPEFVLMFLPLEHAFLLAMDREPALYSEAMAQNVCLVSPSTFLATLKIIHHIWKQEAQNENAQKIANTGAKLYDKIAGFIDSFKEVGANIDKSYKKYNEALGRLSDGRGNALGLAEQLKELGVSSKKSIQNLG